MQKEIDALLSERPGLKAKDIAKCLKLPRKEINSFLYSHKDQTYRQDSEFKWFLLYPPKKTLVLRSGWHSGDRFEDDLSLTGPLIDDSVKAVDIVFSNNCKPMIDSVAKILALTNQLAQRGTTVTLDFSGSKKSLTYLNRAGFFDLLDSSISVLPRRPTYSAAKAHQGNSATLVEFERVEPNDENEDLKEKLTHKFVVQTSDQYRTAAFTIFSELIGNVKEHSETQLWGFAASQRYGGTRSHIQAVVSDNGLGIAATLRPALNQFHPHLYEKYGEETLENDMALVRETMGNGLVSRKGEGRGLGFYSSRQQAVKFNAEFTVRQAHFLLRFQFEQGKLTSVSPRTGLPILHGTHICFDFFID
ncbi:ATP-binding protein [Marinobacter nauticus]|uniref:ATP-binding protein n=1 Tax=Marinobacter nauticus TaxID=2743 RepID=UPI0024203B93|nr:ATP-binding protein [Marinobacter nauticus]